MTRWNKNSETNFFKHSYLCDNLHLEKKVPLHCFTGVLQASGTDITSTDELVMVLTDHDYQEGHEGENADNSNIVVLYSHPVDGQQSQFITSQVSIGIFLLLAGNLLSF